MRIPTTIIVSSLALSLLARPTFGGDGIARKYQHDTGIGNDPAGVISGEARGVIGLIGNSQAAGEQTTHAGAVNAGHHAGDKSTPEACRLLESRHSNSDVCRCFNGTFSGWCFAAMENKIPHALKSTKNASTTQIQGRSLINEIILSILRVHLRSLSS